MSDPKSANDPSMDDILASIRKIISDDEARAQADPQHVRGPAAGRDDVLLLTDLIEEPNPGAAGAVTAPPIPLPRIDPARAAEMPQPSFEASRPDTRPDSGLVGGGAAASAASAFSRLSQAVEDSVPRAAVTEAGPMTGNDGKTVEELVKETLRPMLKEWLDRNLPTLVERCVDREIARLTRR